MKLLLHYSGDDRYRCDVIHKEHFQEEAEILLLPNPIKWIQMCTKLDEPFDFRMTRNEYGTISVKQNLEVSLKYGCVYNCG